jgi:hypothetical protein
MIENVRSIAIVTSLQNALIGELRGLYRRHRTTASARVTRLPPLFGMFSYDGRVPEGEDYSNFTEVNPV